MRKAFTLILLAGIVAAAAWTVLGHRNERSATDPWRAVPSTTPLVIEITDPLGRWDRWTHSSRWWQVIAGSDLAGTIDTVADRLSHRAESDPALAREMASRTLLIALFPDATAGIDALYICDMTEGPALTAVRQALDGTKLVVAIHEDIVIASSDTALLAEARRTLAEPAQDRPIRSSAARATLGRDADAHIVADMGALPRLFGAGLAPSAVDALGPADGWTALDVSVRPETIFLSGLHRPERPVRRDTSSITRPVIARGLPASVCTFSFLSLHDPRGVAPASNGTAQEEAHALLDWCDGRALIAQAPPDSTAGLAWAVLGTIDPEQTWRSLLSLCDSNGCDTTRYREQLLAHMERPSLFERVLGPRWWKLERPWFAVLGDEVVFCDDMNGVKQAVDAWIDGTGLAGDLQVADFVQQHAVPCAAAQWWHGSRGRALLAANATGALQAAMEARPLIMGSIGNALLMRSSAANGDEFVTIVLGTGHGPGVPFPVVAEASDAAGDPSDVLWSVELPAAPARKPFIVRNHMNGTREVLVQDEQHAVHLVSAAGGLLWSRPLDGPILGDVRQVDRFRNGKLQLLFNTAGTLYLVDRNGRDVQGFPVKVKDGCAAPLAVFDYENTRDYRILLPTQEGGVLNLDMDGRQVEGWAPPRLGRVSDEPVRFIRVRGKDHLLVFDAAGTVHVWGRRGEMRYQAGLSMAGIDRVLDVRPGATIGATRITWRQEDGRVWRGTLDGKDVDLVAARADRAIAAEAGGVQRIILTSGDTLFYAGSKDPPIIASVPGGFIEGPAYYDLGQQWYIGVRSPDGLHLFNAAGAAIAPSPLASPVLPSIADLNLDGRYEMVAGRGERGIATYRLP